MIQVEDNGIGMDPEMTKRIIEPFYTTRRNSGGTELGLSVSYGLIREHSGVIGILSRPGLGSRFTVFLPVDRDIKLDLRPSILCVDDDEGFLSILQACFVDTKNMQFEFTGSPEGVIEYLEQHPETDIVLWGIEIPEMNGWELFGKIKKRFPLLTVILYSAYPEHLKQKPDNVPSPDHLLQKPFKMERLMEIVNTIGRQRL